MIHHLLSYNINSSKQNIQSGTSDNFTYLFNIPASALTHVNSVSVVSISLPKSFYQINEQNNVFTLIENSVPIIITMIPGNYSSSQWFTALGLAMTAASLNAITYSVNFQYSTLSNGIMKITASNIVLALALSIPGGSIAGVLGFSQNTVYNFTSGVLLSVYVINLNESDMIYLNSDIISSPFNDATNSSSNTLCICYTGSYQNYSYVSQSFNMIDNMKRFAGKNSSFSFYLIDENGTPINLHGVDFSFTINVFQYTPNEIIYKKISDYIVYSLKKDKIITESAIADGEEEV